MIIFVLKIVAFFSVILPTSEHPSPSNQTQHISRSPHPNERQGGSPRSTLQDLTYYLYTPDAADHYTVIKSYSIHRIKDTNFSTLRNTVFIIHGWDADRNSLVNTLILKAMLARYDVNVFVLDWSPITKLNYLAARISVTKIGKFLALFVRSLMETHKLKLSNVTFIGHSLGAHVAGNAGAKLGGKVNQIIGLDPAGIGFSVFYTENRLDPTDAQFVQVIHTGSRLLTGLGFATPIGHADYYPNGREIQPGCGVDLMGMCSHSRAYYYYAESLSRAHDRRFRATECEDMLEVTVGFCSDNPASFMGGYPVDKSASGLYYLRTHSEAPYAKG